MLQQAKRNELKNKNREKINVQNKNSKERV